MIESAPPDTVGLWEARIRLALLGHPADPDRRHQEFLGRFDEASVKEDDWLRSEGAWRKVVALRKLGREAEARAVVRRFRGELEVRATIGTTPVDESALVTLLALEGRKEELVSLREHLLRFATADPFTGPRVKKWIAASHVILGEYDQAVDILREFSRTDYQFNLASYELHADPVWEPLREAGLLDDVWHELRDRERRVEAQSRRGSWDKLGSLIGPRTLGWRAAVDGDRRP